MNTSEKINFQLYVESVKQKKTPWNIFENLMKHLVSYLNANKLKYLNAILLTELTKNYSDIERLKYLNTILLSEFKELIMRQEGNFENEILEESPKFTSVYDLNHTPINEEDEIQIEKTLENEQKKNLLSENGIEFNERQEDDSENELLENSPKTTVGTELSDKLMEELIPNTFENQLLEEFNDTINKDQNKFQMEYEGKENSDSPYEEKITENDQKQFASKTFSCHICNKEYSMNFHLKQHCRNVHEKKKSTSFHLENIHIDKNELPANKNEKAILNSNNVHEIDKLYKYYKCEFCDRSFSQAENLKSHVQSVHKGYKNNKCDACSKSFTTLQSLEKHLHTVHDGYKDYKCESCDKSFAQSAYLKKHIHTIHEGHKD